MAVTTHASVDEFFRDILVEAMERQDVAVTEETECYLVGLLGDFTHQRITDEPLSLKLVGTNEPAERVRALKEVGDTTLYVTGFFSDSLDRKLVDADYYIGLGEAAYRELSVRLSASSASAVYDELALKFPRFVDVLAEISNSVNFVGCDVVKLYEQWRKTRSEWIEQRLRGLGMLVPGPRTGGKDTLQ